MTDESAPDLAVVFRGRLEAVKEVAAAFTAAGLAPRVQNPGGAAGNA